MLLLPAISSGFAGCLVGLTDNVAPLEVSVAERVLFSPTWLTETAVLLRLNNTSGRSVDARVVFEGGEADYTGFFAQKIYRFSPSGDETLGRAGYGTDRAVVELRYDGQGFQVGPGIGAVPLFYNWPLDHFYNLELVPGVQHVLIGVQGPAALVSLVLDTEPLPVVESELVLVDSGMTRWLLTSVEGHWDDVALEAWSAAGGTVLARTELELRHSYRWALITTFGLLSESEVRDAAGTSCSSAIRSGFPAWLVQPALGPVQAEATVYAQHGGVHAILTVLDLPLPSLSSAPRCIGSAAESSASRLNLLPAEATTSCSSGWLSANREAAFLCSEARWFAEASQE